MEEKARILVVDDEKEICRILEKFLTAEGYRVVTVTNGQGAIRAMREERCDLIFLDLRLPDMNGIEVLRRIKKMDEKAVVNIMTGYGTMQTARAAMRLGAHDYITKPIDLDYLKTLVEDALKEGRGETTGE